MQQAPVEPATLRAIAKASGGTFYAATSATALSQVYKQLGARLVYGKQYREVTVVVTAVALAADPRRRRALGLVVPEARVSVRLLFVVALAALAAAAAPGRVGAANECAGIPRCIPVAGPWVAVPAHGEAEYVLQCPQGRGIVGGTDAQASSLDVRATFDGIIGSPVAFGRTTLSSVLFRALSATHKPGLVQALHRLHPGPEPDLEHASPRRSRRSGRRST